MDLAHIVQWAFHPLPPLFKICVSIMVVLMSDPFITAVYTCDGTKAFRPPAGLESYPDALRSYLAAE